jgi:hypothetical protein
VNVVVLPALAFALLRALPALALILLLAVQGPPRPDRTGDVLLGAWLALLSAAFGALGFVLPTAASAAWRRLGVRRAVLVAAALGLLSPVAGFAVAALSASAIRPLFRAAPWLAIALFHGLPGVALGLLAVLVAWAWPNRAHGGHELA